VRVQLVRAQGPGCDPLEQIGHQRLVPTGRVREYQAKLTEAADDLGPIT
jgi:hypothetical protein